MTRLGDWMRDARGWCALALLSACGCEHVSLGRPNPADRPVAPSHVLDFVTLYAKNCAGCHGADGRLGPGPPLNDPLFLAIVPDEALSNTIGQGRTGTPMPAFARKHGGTLTDEQVQALAAGIKQRWKPATPGETPWPAYAQPATDAPPGEEQLARGAEVFAQACAGCHVPPKAGEATSPPGPVNDSHVLALMSDQLLRRIVITGRPDLGMPSFAASEGRNPDFKPLTEPDIEALVALLANWRQPGAAGQPHVRHDASAGSLKTATLNTPTLKRESP